MAFFTTEMRRDPYPLYRAMRGAPVARVPGVDLFIVLDYANVRRALTDHETFGSNVAPPRNGSFDWLLFTDPPRHAKLRAIVSQAFTPRSIASLEPFVEALAGELVAAAIDKGEVDFVADVATPLPMRVIAEMLGLPASTWPKLAGWSEAIMNLADTIAGPPDLAAQASAAFVAANGEMKPYFDSELAARRASPRADLLTRLVEAEVDGERLSGDELLRFVHLLLAAGTETTTNLLSNTALSFLNHPDELRRVRAGEVPVASAIEEVLRFRCPVQFMFRVTKRDVELSGVSIPAGKMLLVGIGAANRDPSAFEDAERFDVARSPNPHVAFGHGIHFCLGAPLARLEARVAIGVLLARVAAFERVSNEPWEPRRAFHVHGPRGFAMRFTPASR